MCNLWDDPRSKEQLEELGVEEPNFIVCDACGKKQHIGDYPICWGKYGCHEPTTEYRPFVAFFDIGLGKHIDGLATWNREMHKSGWDLADRKHDREPTPPKASAAGLTRAFNKAVREVHGGVLPVGSFLRDDD